MAINQGWVRQDIVLKHENLMFKDMVHPNKQNSLYKI